MNTDNLKIWFAKERTLEIHIFIRNCKNTNIRNCVTLPPRTVRRTFNASFSSTPQISFGFFASVKYKTYPINSFPWRLHMLVYKSWLMSEQ